MKMICLLRKNIFSFNKNHMNGKHETFRGSLSGLKRFAETTHQLSEGIESGKDVPQSK